MAELNARSVVVVAAAEQVDSEGRQWIEVMPTAEKARNGPFYFTVTRDDLEAYADYIRANPDSIVVDYDHEGASGGSTAAAGWFTGEAEVRDTAEGPRLFAQVGWTPQGREDLASKRFRFISPEFSFKDRDGKTGLMTKAKELLAATLTNRPFFRELAAVAAEADEIDPDDEAVKAIAAYFGVDVEEVALAGELALRGGDEFLRRVADSKLDEEAKERLTLKAQQATGGAAAPNEGDERMSDLATFAAELGLPDDATEEQIVAAVKAAREKAEAAAKLRGTGSPSLNAELIAALGLNDAADEADVLAAVRMTKKAADRLDQIEPELEGLQASAARTRTLEGRIKALEAERKAEQVDRILTDGVRQKKVVPAEKAALAKQFSNNPDGLRELISARPDGMFSALGSGGGRDDEEDSDVVSLRDEFDSTEADGIDADSARLHVRAERILREQGKRTYTEGEYADALVLASKND